MYCPNCGSENGNAKFCSNCGSPMSTNLNPSTTSIDNAKQIVKKPFYKKWWFWVLSLLALIILISIAGGEKEKTPSQAASDLNQQIDTTTPTPKPDESKTETTTEVVVTNSPEPEPQEINPDIPLGTVYTLNQGEYECGVDIPAGRYVIEWESGNQFGGHISASNNAKYLDDLISINPGETYTCILSSGDKFEISLSSMKFTKVTSLPNNCYLQEDGSYLLGSGYFFEGIDIPLGKYNVTAVGGNQFGIMISTKTKSYLSLDQGETYSNLSLNNTGAVIEISLGDALFTPVG